MSSVPRTPEEEQAIREAYEDLQKGHRSCGGMSGGARRRALRERLEELAGPFGSFDTPEEWLASRERALERLRAELGHTIEDLRGEYLRRIRGLGRWFPSAEVRRLRGERLRRVLDLLEVLGRLAEIRELRRGLVGCRREASCSVPPNPGPQGLPGRS